MTRLMYIINGFLPGGAERAMVRLCHELDGEFEIRVVGLLPADGAIARELDANGISYDAMGFRKRLSDVFRIWRLGAAIRRFEPGIIICSLYHASVLGVVLGRMAGVGKIVSWEHSGDLGSPARRLGKRLIDRMAWKVFCDSRATFERYRALTGSRKAVLMPIGGLDTSVFAPADKPHDGIVIASVGRLKHIKGYDLLIESARQLVADMPHITYRIAADGEERHALERLIRQYGLDNQIFLDGWVDDVPDFLAGADIYVQPSRNEGQCIAVIEAMACGLPVVGARQGGIADAIEDGASGFLADPSDTKTWNEKLTTLINDSKRRYEMGKRGRAIAVQRYDIKTTIESFKKEL